MQIDILKRAIGYLFWGEPSMWSVRYFKNGEDTNTFLNRELGHAAIHNQSSGMKYIKVSDGERFWHVLALSPTQHREVLSAFERMKNNKSYSVAQFEKSVKRHYRGYI